MFMYYRIFFCSILFAFSVVVSAEESLMRYNSLSDHYEYQVRVNSFNDEPYIRITSYLAPEIQHTQYIPTSTSSSAPNFRPRTNAVDTSDGDTAPGGWNEMGCSDDDLLLLVIIFFIYCVIVNIRMKLSRCNTDHPKKI